MEAQILSHTLKPAGRCIYCGVTDDLTLEHIIPFGLWGRIEFPDASCKACAKKINEEFEAPIMQSQLGAFRQRSKIPRRKGRPRNYKHTLVFGHMSGSPPPPEPIEITGDDVPRTILLMRFMPPKIFIDRWPKGPAIWFYQNSDDQREFMEKHPNPGIFMGTVDLHKFCRLIAKISHGLVLGYMPPKILDTFQLLLPDLILNGTEDFHHLVGGNFTVPEACDLMHDWKIANAVRGNVEYLFAKIRLFGCLGAPWYLAVVASRPLGEATVTKDPVHFPSPE